MQASNCVTEEKTREEMLAPVKVSTNELSQTLKPDSPPVGSLQSRTKNFSTINESSGSQSDTSKQSSTAITESILTTSSSLQ